MFQEHLTLVFDAEDDLAKLQAARLRVDEEIRALEDRLLTRREEVARTKEELRMLGVT